MDKKSRKSETNMQISSLLERVATALERLAPQETPEAEISAADAFIWHRETGQLVAVSKVNRIDMKLLRGIDRNRDILLQNTRQFANGFPANNALLWGARGMGKSSLVKAVHHHLARSLKLPLKLIEIHREDINTLTSVMHTLRRHRQQRFIIFCDDLSFDEADTSYKSLKAILEGGIEGRPEHVIFYATSNRRHLMPRNMMENERSTAINPSEAVEEKVSLSDRFGLWIGFHNCTQKEYLEMVTAYAEHFGLEISGDELKARAMEWSMTRGARSGRVAWQFILDLAGRQGKNIQNI